MLLARYKKVLTFISLVINLVCCMENNSEIREHRNETSRVLSRHKRFLIFPEGSSLQLVFCLSEPLVSDIGDIIFFGTTVALAWELPQDPYSPFMHHADPLHRRGDTKNVYYTDEKGKILFKKPFKKRPIVNPAFAKRSVDDTKMATQNAGPAFGIDRKWMHDSQKERDFLKTEQMDARSVEFHRNGRLSLYEKMESLLGAFGTDGRQCLLKTLCEVNQTRHQTQSSFLQEILRAVFTLPKGQRFLSEYHQMYDTASAATGSCEQLYPDCDEPLSGPGSTSFSY